MILILIFALLSASPATSQTGGGGNGGRPAPVPMGAVPASVAEGFGITAGAGMKFVGTVIDANDRNQTTYLFRDEMGNTQSFTVRNGRVVGSGGTSTITITTTTPCTSSNPVCATISNIANTATTTHSVMPTCDEGWTLLTYPGTSLPVCARDIKKPTGEK